MLIDFLPPTVQSYDLFSRMEPAEADQAPLREHDIPWLCRLTAGLVSGSMTD